MTRGLATRRSSAAPAAALLLIQLAVGYEWLVSGLTKIARGDFPAGLGSRLTYMAKGAPGWYGSFLRSAVVPHAAAFGYTIETSEVLVGLVLGGIALVLLVDHRHVSLRLLRRLQVVVGIAALAGIAMAVNFELASNGDFGLRLATNSFGEAVDLDTIMIALQLALLVVGAAALPKRTWSRLLH